MIKQKESLVLPIVWSMGTELETIADVLEHVSQECNMEYIQEKAVQIMAVEQVVAGAPGNLLWWVETSPVPSTESDAYWAAIGGGGGYVAPITPMTIVGAGINNLPHSARVAFTISNKWFRVVVQTPVINALAGWAVQVTMGGKTPGG